MIRHIFNYFVFYRPSIKRNWEGLKIRPVSYRQWRAFNTHWDDPTGRKLIRAVGIPNSLQTWIEDNPDWKNYYE